MNTKISKTEAVEKIFNFFKDISKKTPKEIKKIKRLAANKKISLIKYKTLFCPSCLIPYKSDQKIRIKNGFKTIECNNCGKIKRIKLS